MKKTALSIVYMMGILLFVLLFSGCGGKDKEEDPTLSQVIGISITPMPTPTPVPQEGALAAVTSNGSYTMVNEYLLQQSENTVDLDTAQEDPQEADGS